MSNFIFLVTLVKKNYYLPLIVTFILTAYQLIRIIAFINVYGGIEHDGGWMLSISRSLAERGAYTTMVSTIIDPTVPGDINVDQKFDIQAADGRIWFFTGNGIGPSSIIPDAVVLKVFGTDFWALRTGPLIFYTLFLIFAAYVLYQLAGLGAIVLFHAFLFFYPHISIFLGYEAMGEVPGMFYILWAYLAFAAATQKQQRRLRYFFIAGLVIGLAINAKLITLWSVSGIFIWAGLLWLIGVVNGWLDRSTPGRDSTEISPQPDNQNPKSKTCTEYNRSIQNQKSLSLSELLLLSSGIPLTLVAWELAHMVILTRLAGFEMYLRQAEQRLKFILDDGSGVGLRIHSGSEFFWDKFFVLDQVAHPQRWVTAIIFTAIFAGGIVLLRFWRSQPKKQNLLAPLWVGWLVNTAWFVGLAKTGWPRHFWFGLVLAIMLLCIVVVALLMGDKGDTKYESRIDSGLPAQGSLGVGIGLLVLIGWGFASQPHVRGFFVPDEIVPYWQQQQIDSKYGANLPWIIIPRASQGEAVAYLRQLPFEANIFYPAQHKAAEISVQVGRVLYPLSRRKFMKAHSQDVALISPTLIAPWMDPVRREALLNLVQEDCPEPILSNDYYMICPLPAE